MLEVPKVIISRPDNRDNKENKPLEVELTDQRSSKCYFRFLQIDSIKDDLRIDSDNSNKNKILKDSYFRIEHVETQAQLGFT